MSSSSPPSPPKESVSSSSSNSSSSSSSGSQQSKILSTKKVGGYLYKLVGYPKTVGNLPSQVQEIVKKPSTKPVENQVRQQKARKSFAPHFKVPPHILGRTPNNPEADATDGKKLQKPRPGVKVPSLNLTSQILTKEELCQEVIQHSARNRQTPIQKPLKPEITFAKKLSNKIASKISVNSLNSSAPISTDGSSPGNCETEIEIVESTEKVSLDQIPPNIAGPVAGILSAVKKRSLLDLMKKEYVSGLNLQKSVSNTEESPTKAAEEKNHDGFLNVTPVDTDNPLSSDTSLTLSLEVEMNVNMEDDAGNPEPNSNSFNENTTDPLQLTKTVAKPNNKNLKKSSSKDPKNISAQGIVGASTVESNAFPTGIGKQANRRNSAISDSNREEVLDVEAAIAALHGEILDEIEVQVPTVGGEKSVIDHDKEEVKQITVQLEADEIETPIEQTKQALVRKKRRSKKRRVVAAKRVSLSASQPTKTNNRNQPVRRELDRLFIDEGAINMLYEMEQKGLSRRRSGLSKERASLIPKEMLNTKTLQKIQNTRLQRRKSAPVTQKSTRGNKRRSAVLNESQDEVLCQWEPLKNVSNGDEAKIVYVPRKFANPADASQIIRRRSGSSDSSYDDTVEDKRRPKKPKHRSSGEMPSIRIESVTSLQPALQDHGYTLAHGKEQFHSTNILGRAVSNNDAQDFSSGFEEIHVRRMEHYIHVIFCSRSPTLQNSFNINMLQELTTFLQQLKGEEQMKVVLFTSAGPAFSTGIDFPCVLTDDLPEREKITNCLATAIQDFILELANCDKLLIGGINGSVVGLGATMLPYLDVIYASDKATFYLPYAKLGQCTEGAVALTFNNNCASSHLISALIYEGRRITATEAEQRGLIDTVLWPSCFQEELIPRVQRLATQTTQATLSSKMLIRSLVRRELPNILQMESQILVNNWMSEEFQRRARILLESGDLLV